MCNHICMQLMQLYYNFTKTTCVIAMQLLCNYNLQHHVDVAFHPSMIMNCFHFYYNCFEHFYLNILFKLVWTRCIMHPICLWRGPAFRPTGPGMGGGEGEVYYRQTRPGTLGFRPDSAQHSRISTDWARRGGWGKERSVTDRPGLALPDFNRPGPTWGVGEGEVCYRRTRPDFSLAASPASPFPHPPKPSSQTQRLTKLIYTNSIGNG
jgi:hypothetical protein